jgi:hypothetical protein
MPTLRELQAMFRRAMFGAEVPPLVEAIAADGLTPAARLQIYRHHVLTSLTEALQATFPVVCRLVDARFFGYAADTYIRQHPPEAPCLFEYGAPFSAFLATFPPCRELVYLADVARLEWALNVALHAEACAPIAPDALRDMPGDEVAGLTFQCHPSLTLLRSPWPIDQIWRANQAAAAMTAAAIDLRAGGVCLEILRWEDAVGFRTLAPPVYVFRAALATGQRLASAVEAALAADEGFDVVRALGALLADGIITGWAQSPDMRESRVCNHM